MPPKLEEALKEIGCPASLLERTEQKLNHILAEIGDLWSIADDEVYQAYEAGNSVALLLKLKMELDMENLPFALVLVLYPLSCSVHRYLMHLMGEDVNGTSAGIAALINLCIFVWVLTLLYKD